MKKTALLLAILMLFSVVLTACKEDTPATPPTTSDKAAITGIWYSEKGVSVFDFKEDGTLSLYFLLPGYYEYDTVYEGTYTFENNTVVTKCENMNDVTLTFDPNMETLTDTNKYVFVKNSKLPELHPTYTFPLYTNMDCASLVQFASFESLKLHEEMEIISALKLFNAVHQETEPEDLPTVKEDRPAAYGDFVSIDYLGKLDGIAFDGGKAEGAQVPIIGESGYIAGFAEGIIGHKVGETFDVDVTFPEDYHSADLAGKAVVFTMKLNAIYDTALSYEDALEVVGGEYATYDEILAAVVENNQKSHLWDQVMAGITYDEIPSEYTQFFVAYYEDYYHSYAFQYGMSYETLLQALGVTQKQIEQSSIDSAMKYIASVAIIRNNDLSWTEEDYNEMFDTFVADAMAYFECDKEEATEYVLENEANQVHAELAYSTALDWLYEQLTAEEPEA